MTAAVFAGERKFSKSRGLSASVSFLPSPPPLPHFHFLALVSFLARPKPRIPFLGLSLFRKQTETLATQANYILADIFQGLKMLLAICNNTKENLLWEPEKMKYVKFHKITSYSWNFQNFICVFRILLKFWHSFSRTLITEFLWCYYRWLITSFTLEKSKKEHSIL